jgi:hypothetical protein
VGIQVIVELHCGEKKKTMMVENIKYRYATDVVVKRVMNKLKLGLFGDSYGEDVHQKSAWNSKLKATPCWHDILGANSHALGGTDIQYSFLEFERYHNLYDQVIFILTQPHRMTLVHNDTILKMNDWSSEKQINQWTIKGILGQFKKPIAISNESKWQVVAGFEGEPDVEGESLDLSFTEMLMLVAAILFVLSPISFLMSSIIVSRLPSAPIAACLAIMVFFSCVDQAPAGELREIYEGKAANERGDHEAAHEHFHEAAESATGERGAQLHLASGASASKAKLWGSAVSSYTLSWVTVSCDA